MDISKYFKESVGLRNHESLLYLEVSSRMARWLVLLHLDHEGRRFKLCLRGNSGPSSSKLTMSLVKDSLKFTSSDTQIC